MALSKFRRLSPEKQASIALHQGVFIALRTSGDLTILLYELNGFYVEMYYDRPKIKLHMLRCFSSTHELDPYLQDIDLTTLFG